MKAGIALDLLMDLQSIEGEGVPFKMFLSNQVSSLVTATKTVTDKKQERFLAHVMKDETGRPILSEAVEKGLKDGSIKPQGQLPFEAFRFKSEEDFKAFKLYTEEVKEEEVSFEVEALALNSLVYVGADREITIESFLNSPICKLTTAEIALLLSHGLIK